LSRLEAVTRQALTDAMLTYLSPRDQRNPLVSDPGPHGPEWTGPTADHHRDLTVLTAAVRGELDRAVRTVNATLGMTGKQPCNA
jgi:hypothetical protein